MEAIDWSSGAPRSPRHDDVYFSRSGALAQARHVFLGGCALPEAWAGHARWHLLETGFGLGLNFLATWLAWRDDPGRAQKLIFESIEAWPVSADDIVRAAGSEPALQPLAHALASALANNAAWRLPTDGCPPADSPVVRTRFDDGQVELIIHIGDALTLLPHPAARDDVDSIFLDGFSPARNPTIWSAPVLAGVAARLRRGGRLATWSVAASVREALQAAGLELRRQAGLPPKRHCLVAWRPDSPRCQ